MNPDADPVTRGILRARAAALARIPVDARTAGPAIEVIEFGLASERWAIETTWVQEVTSLNDLAPLPGTPAFVRGLINLRGRILPVVDLKRFFALPETGITDLHRILVLDAPDMVFGLLADTVGSVRRLPLDRLQPPPATLGAHAGALRGITSDPLIVLDGSRFLTDRRLLVHEEVEP